MERGDFASQESEAQRTSGALRWRAPHGLFLGLRAAAGLMLVAVPALAAATAEWTPVTVSMAARRYAPTATLLSAGASTIKGRVLVAGGYTGSTASASAQLFDPNTGAWSTTGALRTGRAFATATDFGDGTGRVLVAGGFTSTFYGWSTQKSAEIYNPSTGTFSYVTRTVNRRATQIYMNQYRELFTATRLPNGKILLVGGIYGGQTTVRTAELFDPTAMTFTYTGSMQTPSGRFGHDAVLIPPAPADSPFYNAADQGKVLVVGGKEHAPDGWHSLQTAELYDVATGSFTSIPILHSRDRPRVAWVPSVGASYVTGTPPVVKRRGMVLVVGGKFDDTRVSSTTHDVLESEWFDPTTNTFSEGPLLQQGRMAHTLTALGDGSLLAAGGWSDALEWTDGSGRKGRSTDTAERFVPNPLDPLFGSFVSISTMADPRQDHEAVALPGNRVLVVGGKPNVDAKDTYLDRAEVYTRP